MRQDLNPEGKKDRQIGSRPLFVSAFFHQWHVNSITTDTVFLVTASEQNNPTVDAKQPYNTLIKSYLQPHKNLCAGRATHTQQPDNSMTRADDRLKTTRTPV